MVYSQEDLDRMNTPHPDLLEALQRRPHPDLTGGDPNATTLDVRRNRAANLVKLRHLYTIPGPIPEQVKESNHLVTVRNGYKVSIKIYVPVQPPATGSPLVVMMHEGGWSMGDLTDEDLNCRLFARDLGAVCVNVDYRLSPEHPFPTGLNDCWDVVQWCGRTASPENEQLPADSALGFIVGGASAGGNLAAVMAQLSRDEALNPPITGQYLCCASLLWWDVVPEKWKAEYRSRQTAVHDPILTTTRNPDGKLFRELQWDTHSPRFSPLLHENLQDLAPAYFQVGGLDPLRDESLLYDRVLKENGVQTRMEVYDGFGHMFWANWRELLRSREFVEDTVKGVRWLLEAGRKS